MNGIKNTIPIGTICRVLKDADNRLMPNSIVEVTSFNYEIQGSTREPAVNVREIITLPGRDYEGDRQIAADMGRPFELVFWEDELEPWGAPDE